jgi:hypothetical protein
VIGLPDADPVLDRAGRELLREGLADEVGESESPSIAVATSKAMPDSMLGNLHSRTSDQRTFSVNTPRTP